MKTPWRSSFHHLLVASAGARRSTWPDTGRGGPSSWQRSRGFGRSRSSPDTAPHPQPLRGGVSLPATASASLDRPSQACRVRSESIRRAVRPASSRSAPARGPSGPSRDPSARRFGGSGVTGQPLDPGQAFVAGVTGAAAGVGCLGGPWACAGASAAASAVQYGLAPGEKSAEGLILASSLGAGLGRLSYKPPFVPTANRFRPNPISLGALNPAWPRIADGLIRATGEFARSLSASLISGIAPSLVGGSAVAGSRVLGKAGVPVTASGRTGLGREMR